MTKQEAKQALNTAITILSSVRERMEQGDSTPRRFREKLDGVVSGIKSAIGDLG